MINTTLLTDDEKEFLEELQYYLYIAHEKMETIKRIGIDNPMMERFMLSRWHSDIQSLESEIKSLQYKANCRTNRILTLCHTGK